MHIFRFSQTNTSRSTRKYKNQGYPLKSIINLISYIFVHIYTYLYLSCYVHYYFVIAIFSITYYLLFKWRHADTARFSANFNESYIQCELNLKIICVCFSKNYTWNILWIGRFLFFFNFQQKLISLMLEKMLNPVIVFVKICL